MSGLDKRAKSYSKLCGVRNEERKSPPQLKKHIDFGRKLSTKYGVIAESQLHGAQKVFSLMFLRRC